MVLKSIKCQVQVRSRNLHKKKPFSKEQRIGNKKYKKKLETRKITPIQSTLVDSIVLLDKNSLIFKTNLLNYRSIGGVLVV